MSYIVLARKYRPQKFDEIVGQDAVSTTLKNAVSLNRIAHAYLFSGPRGVGKTSMARIFSKALNCKNGPTSNPCGKCQACIEIEESRSLDVMEIDGASNRGIEDIRSIRENIKFKPAYGKYKIYIIDEVHQITQDGFNALLKTLEEPPSHAKFIFATTASQKVPATVLSRCQRFDFRRIKTSTITGVLKELVKSEKFKISDDAILEIAKAADGSLRDAESILDQLSSFSKKEIRFEDVARSLGSMGQESFISLFDTIINKDAPNAIRFVNNVLDEGKEPAYFLEKCLEHIRNLMVIKTASDLKADIEGSDSYLDGSEKQAKSFSIADLFYLFSVIHQGLTNLKIMSSKKIALEVAILKSVLREPMISIKDAIEEVKKNPSKSPKSVSEPIDAVPKSSDAEDKPLEDALEEKNPQEDNLNESADIPDGLWEHFVKRVKVEKISAATFLKDAEPLTIRDGNLIVGFPPECSFHIEALSTESNQKLFEKHLTDLLSKRSRIRFELMNKTKPDLGGQGSSGGASREEEPEIVKSALGIFGGKVIKST